MFQQSACIVATVLIAAPTLAIAQRAVPQRVLRPTADAGTGPYLTSAQAGLTGYMEGPSTVQFEKNIAEFTSLLGEIEGWRSLRLEPDRLTTAVKDLRLGIMRIEGDPMAPRLRGAGFEPFRSSLDTLMDSISTIADFARHTPTARVYARAIDRAIRAANIAEKAHAERVRRDEVEDFQRTFDKSANSGSGALKLGVYHSGSFALDSYRETGSSSLGFGTLTYSLGEQVVNASENFRRAVFVTASALGPLDSSGTGAVSRFGIGMLAGDPRRVVSGLSVASFISPSALDAEASISLKALSSPIDKEPSSTRSYTDPWWDRRTWVANREPHLMDHVRSGDLWLAGNVRYISNSNTFPTSTALEATLTYALRRRSYENDKTQSPIAATTLELTGTYCAQHMLGVDELGVELRTPIGGHGLHAWPIYFSARYGTRSDFTLALETRF